MTIGLCLIVKNTKKEIELAKKAIASVGNAANHVYITLTGSVESIELPKSEENIFYSYFKWCDDFAKARNFNFSQSKDQWIFWIDADDIVLHPENIKQVIQAAEDNGNRAVFLKYLYDHDKKGNVTMWHWKIRFVRNDKHGSWKGKIHEDFLQDRKVKWAKDSSILIDHKTTDERRLESVKRNLAILMKDYDEQGENKDPRTLFLMGTAFLQLNQLEAAEESYNKYLELSGWPEERYDAYQRLGDIASSKKDFKKARGYYLAGSIESPQWPDSYFNVAKSYAGEEEWGKVIEWSEIGFTKRRQESMTMNLPRLLTIIPGSLYAYALLQVGRLDDAMAAVANVAKLDPKDDYLLDMQHIIHEAWMTKEMSAWFVKIVNDLKEGKEKWKIPALMQAIPKRLKSHPITTFLNANYLPPKKWSDKSIVFFCGNTAEPWTPKSLEQGGIGGSETAVIFLARLLAKMGWEVTVFNWCDTSEGVYDGVTYRNNWEFSPNDDYNIVILWRVVELLSSDIKAKKIYLDLHDVPDVNEFTEERIKKVTKIFVKSKYHRSLLPKVSDEKFIIIPNGIDVSRYVDSFKHKKIPHSAIYSSSPNRGLDTLLDMWPKIREVYPDATLRVFYGWNTFFALEKGNPASLIWMETIKKKMDSLVDNGVINMGRVSQKELAEWQMKSQMWLYPTMFPEISPVHGDTEIETLSGRKKIRDIEDSHGSHVYSCDDEGKLSISVVNGVFKTRENAPMIKLTLKPGTGRGASKEKTLTLTPDHEVMLQDGTYKEAGKLLVGDKVKAFHRQKNAWGNGYDMVGVTGQDIKPEHRFVAEWEIGEPLDDDQDVDHLDGNTHNNEPENLEGKTRSQHWKDTWSRKNPADRKVWADSRLAVLEKFHKSMSKEQLSEVKRQAVRKRWGLKNHTVVKIEVADNADAYCMEVDPDHNFVANGIFVHNCITAMEVQAANCIPICTDYAALSETVQFGEKIPSPISRPKNKELFLNTAIAFLGEHPGDVMSTWAKETYSWDKIAESWDKELKY